MDDLDFGPHVECKQCGKLVPNKRALEYNDNHFCGITCKKAKEKEDDERLTRSHLRVVTRYTEH